MPEGMDKTVTSDPVEDRRSLILVVDDDEANRELLRDLLEVQGHEVVEAENGGAALELVQNCLPDVILLDLMMPVMDGFEVCQRLKEDPKTAPIPVIMITALQEREDRLRGIKAGANDFLTKPIDKEDVILRLKNAVYTKRLHDQIRDQNLELQDKNEQLKEAARLRDVVERITRYELGERIKEQQCLYAISEISGRSDISLEEILQAVVDVISPGWQYPKITCVRFSIEDKKYTTDNFQETEWRQRCEVLVDNENIGEIEVYYLKERPEEDEGPFLKEEADLIQAIAEHLSLIIERFRAEETQEKLEAQLLQAQKLETIGTLAGGIAHDFNNILTPIFGYLNLAQQELPPDNPVHARLEQVLRASSRAKDLVQQILVFSRKAEQERKPMQLHFIVKEALKLLKASLPSTIEIKQNIDSEAGTVLADPTQIHQMIMNICTNAYQAMFGSGGTLEINLKKFEVTSAFAKMHPNLGEGSYVLLTISDTGHGMDSETVASIFEPFYTTKEVGEGTGLGLSIVHGIVMSHDGEITVYSEPGVGTAFNIYLPKVDIDAGQEVHEDEISITGDERILIVDDEETIVELAGEILTGLGYSVSAFVSSTEALETFRENPDMYDLVISDHTMPGYTGTQMAEELMSIRPDVPIIIMSGFGLTLTPEKCEELGIRDFLTKPFHAYDLGRSIRKVIDKEL